MMPPITPTGALKDMVVTSPGKPFGKVSPMMPAVWEAKNRIILSRPALVARVREIGAPISMASICASSSKWHAMISCAR